MASQPCQYGADLGLTEAERAQRSERLGLCFERLGFYGFTVRTAIGVREAKSRRGAALDEEFAAMGGAMMHAAQREKILGRVLAAFGA